MEARLDVVSVLVLDDHRFMQHVLRAMLHGFGIRTVVSVFEAEEAVRLLETERFDLVIADYRLDRESGAWFTKLARASRNGGDRFVPIIACTADTSSRVVQQLRDAGADEILSKPVSAAALWSKISSVVNSRRRFVAAPDFFGPDRRRRNLAPTSGERRVRKD